MTLFCLQLTNKNQRRKSIELMKKNENIVELGINVKLCKIETFTLEKQKKKIFIFTRRRHKRASSGLKKKRASTGLAHAFCVFVLRLGI